MMSTRTSARSSATGGRWLGVGVSAAFALMPIIANASVVDTFYERAVMTAADERCRLFSPEVSSALAAGRAQARGAALRSGVSADQLDSTEARARAAAYSVACNSRDISTAADRVKSAFEPYSRQVKEIYPGEIASWTAERYPASRTPLWALSQPVGFGADRMTFGLASENGKTALLAVADFADGAQPYTARLIIRDPNRARQPYLDKRLADGKGRLPLAARMAPRFATRTYLAEARDACDPRLAPGAAKDALAFRFPAEAAAAIADLDPREAIAVEFAFQGPQGDVVRTAYIEVGDFAAGRAFLSIAQR
jgi:hypothetical protein